MKPVDEQRGGGVITGVKHETVPSPCVSICALDEADICIGCYRSGREISDWGRYGDDEKRAVLQRCAARAAGQDGGRAGMQDMTPLVVSGKRTPQA